MRKKLIDFILKWASDEYMEISNMYILATEDEKALSVRANAIVDYFKDEEDERETQATKELLDITF